MIKALINDEEVEFDGEKKLNYGEGWGIELENGEEYFLFKDSELAGDAARIYWEDMAQDDPEEFTCIVGKESLIAWCLGQSAGPGMVGVNSLEDWFNLVASVPEEHWASYDSLEREFKCDHPDFEKYTVAYRTN